MPERDVVPGWFARRTLGEHHPAPEDVAAALGGLTVGVVLPARDEEATVAGVVRHLRERLVDRVPLLSEVVVVDSHSRDDTARVAREAGATVVACTARPEDGKGGALRTGLDAATADLVVFMDADITSLHDGYVTGLVAPLVTQADLVLVKGFYDRPFSPDGSLPSGPGRPTGGGRVTELVARPTIARRAPLLTGFAQPIGGEYAVRRAAVAGSPLVSGYGVDIGLLLSVVETHGLDATAQVDLGHRVHRHQDLQALGRMALQVGAAFDLCLDGATEVVDELPRFVRDDADRLVLRHDRVVTRLLPPP